MMRIVIEVNGDIIETIEVVNRGPHHNGLPGLFAPSDHAGGPGVRRYRWHHSGRSGSVDHARADGAIALARTVLARVADRDALTPGEKARRG